MVHRPCRAQCAGRVGPRRDTPPPRRGSPSCRTRPATVPSQMPLRRVVSQSETISALSQYETLGTHLEAVYGPYSTSAPCARHSTIDSTGARTRTETEQPSRPCRQGHEGCDLNSVNEIEITPHGAEFRHEGNRLLPSAGRGEGVRPHAPAQGVVRPRPRTDLSA